MNKNILVFAGFLIAVFFSLNPSRVQADIASGLVGWWKLDETSGTLAMDSSGNGLNGTIRGKTSYNETGLGSSVGSAIGKISGAFMFTPPQSYGNYDVEVNDPNGYLNFAAGSFSYSLWIYPPTSQTSYAWEAPLFGAGFDIKCNYATACKSAVTEITGSSTVGFGTKNLQNTWTLLTVVVNRSDKTLKTFTDGVLINSIDISGVGSLPAGTMLQIGEGANWLPFTGAIDDVRVYNRALTAQEIKDLYQLGTVRKTLLVNKSSISTGTGLIAGSSINCGNACSQTVDKGTSITLTATPDGTSYLQSWGYPGCSGSGPCTITMNDDVSITASFRDPVQEDKIITVASCFQTDVQAAIDGASNGNTIIVPPGECSWGALNVNKSITLSGSGQDITIIDIPGWAGASQYGSTGTTINISAPATVKSFTMKVPDGVPSIPAFSTSANGFRISDIKRINAGSAPMPGYFIYSSSYGLVDGCVVDGPPVAGTNEMIFARGPTDSWQTDDSMGGADNLFIENNTFNNRGYVTDCNSNSRCVVRYNTITGPIKIDGHGKASNSPPRGVRHMEVYGNHWTSNTRSAAIELRGGSGMVFGNTSDYAIQSLILNEYAATSGWGNFGDVIQSYPVDDQIGIGKDPKVAGSDPMYIWSNTAGGSPWRISLGYGNSVLLLPIIAPNRDYFADVTTWGPSGVTVGTTAEMQALTPSVKGFGFWVTDQGSWNAQKPGNSGVLYVWDGTSWVLKYTPYPYPHPLRTAISPTQGDISGNGKVTMYDAALVLKYTVGGLLTTSQQTQADMNGDTVIDDADAKAIAKKALE